MSEESNLICSGSWAVMLTTGAIVSTNSENLHTYLAEQFPDASGAIEQIRREGPDASAVNAYTLISEIFWWGIFEPALVAGDDKTIRCCFRVMEELLASDDQSIREAAG